MKVYFSTGNYRRVTKIRITRNRKDGRSEDVNTIPVRGYPECGTAAAAVFMAGEKQSFLSKVIITGKVLFFSTDGACNRHDISRDTVFVSC